MALLKYTPQFIEKQYIPTQDVGLIASMIGQREKEYETGTNTVQQALSEAYGMKSGQGFEAGRNEFADRLKTKFDEAIARRGGDAGAALRDIQTEVINAKKDPFIRANEYNLEEIKRFRDAYDKNKNALVIRDPNTVQYKPGMSQEDMSYSILDPEDVRKMAQIDYAGEAGKKFQGIFRDSSGKYNLQKHSYGPSENRINEILNDPKALERLKQYYPQTQGMDPAKADKFFKGALESTLRSMKKADEVDVIGVDPDYADGLRDSREGGSNGYFGGAAPLGTTMVPESADKNYALNKKSIDKSIAKDAASINLTINTKDGAMPVKSMNDLKIIADEKKPSANPKTSMWMKSLMSDPSTGISYQEELSELTDRAYAARKILNKWEAKLANTTDDRFTYKMWDLDPMSPNPKEAKYNKDNSEVFSNKMKSQIGEMSFAGSKDENSYNKIKADKKVGTIKVNRFVVPSQVSPAAIEFIGEDASGEPIKFMKYVDENATNGILVENQIKDFVRQSPGMMGETYRLFEKKRSEYDNINNMIENELKNNIKNGPGAIAKQKLEGEIYNYLSDSGTPEEKEFRLHNIKSFFPELIKD